MTSSTPQSRPPILKSHTSPSTFTTPFENPIFPTDKFHSLVNKLKSSTTSTKLIIPTSVPPSSSTDINPLLLQTLMRAYISNSEEWFPYFFFDSSVPYTRNLVDEGNGQSNLVIKVWTPHSPCPIINIRANSPHNQDLDQDSDSDPDDIIRHNYSIIKVLQGSLKQTFYELPKYPTHKIMYKIWSTVSSAEEDDDERDEYIREDDLEERSKQRREKRKEKEYKRVTKPMRKSGEMIFNKDDVIFVGDGDGNGVGMGRDLCSFEGLVSEDGEVAVTLHLHTPPNPAREAYHTYDEHTGRKQWVVQNNYFSKFGKRVLPDDKTMMNLRLPE